MREFRTFGNPYLPSWEYVPDGEPHVFGDRVYVYGSHDFFNGHGFCPGDYVCWSAPVNDLTLWRYEGVSYKKTDDPLNRAGAMCLYAPDITIGPDGKYYLYYVLDKVSLVSVAVSETPAGPFRYYGNVRHADGTLLGDAPGDEFQFDPGVITEGSRTYLYTGFCGVGDKSRTGPMVSVIGSDMLTLERGPENLMPSQPYAKGTSFEGHEYFEAASIRKIGDTYYFMYSSVVMHELCYATSKFPDRDFRYRGVLVSNCDLHIGDYKPSETPAYYGGNNHGSIVEIGGRWYVFYHRQTNGTTFSRQGCAEPLELRTDGSFVQAEMTSQGLRGKPLQGRGEYPTYIACNLYCAIPSMYTAQAAWPDNHFPLITQEGRDGDENDGFIGNMMDGAVAVFKYFACEGVRGIRIRVRGYCRGEFVVPISREGPAVARIPVDFTNVWTDYRAEASIPDGVHPLYFRYEGGGIASFASFVLE
jgi:hypothetical protein